MRVVLDSQVSQVDGSCLWRCRLLARNPEPFHTLLRMADFMRIVFPPRQLHPGHSFREGQAPSHHPGTSGASPAAAPRLPEPRNGTSKPRANLSNRRLCIGKILHRLQWRKPYENTGINHLPTGAGLLSIRSITLTLAQSCLLFQTSENLKHFQGSGTHQH